MTIKEALNEAQWEAVSYCEGPSLVIAGAGSGKTRVLTYKVAYLIEQGLPPWNILALTFTNKAAREMCSRIASVVGDEAARNVWAGTFHSIFARILRHEAERLNYSPDYTIYDTADSRSLIKTIIKERGLDDKVYKPQTVAARISEAKNALVLPDQYRNDASILRRDRSENIPETGRIYALYCQRCRAANAMDFDDLLLNTYLLLRNNPAVCDKYKVRFQYILVDEYQDTNTAQHRIISLLTSPSSHICVVGDDAQSIYAFRGARIDNILGFQEQYPTARLIKLERNYRSTQTIVGAANSLIRHNRGQIPKAVYSKGEVGEAIRVINAISDKDEANKVAGEVRRLCRHEGLSFDDIALLYRTNAQSRSFEEAFRTSDIPYRIYGGLSFYQRKEIKDIIAYFRLVANPNDEEAFKRIVNYPARGIGATTLGKIQVAATEHDVSLWTVCADPAGYNLTLSTGTLSRIAGFMSLIESFRQQLATTSSYELASRIVRESGIYADLKADTSPEGISKQENMEELRNAIKQNEDNVRRETGQAIVPLTDYLSQVSLLTDADRQDDGEPKVSLMTVHAAKGLEFDAVFVTGMEDDLFPNANARYSPQEMEEERRLFYVAITRTKRFCFLTYAESRYRYGKVDCSNPSPFLKEIDAKYLDAPTKSTPRNPFERQRWTGDFFAERKPSSRPFFGRNAFASERRAAPSRLDAASSQRSAASSCPEAAPARFAPTGAMTHSSGDGIAPIPALQVGDRVSHDRFGEGTVIALEGTGNSAKACVDFRLAGKKNLLLKFARIKKL